MIFDDVVSNSAWQPEPAARYNAVNALLRESAPLPPQPQQGRGGWSVGRALFYNASNTTIPAWSAVALAPGGNSADQLHCLTGSPATENARCWGIARNSVPAGCCGEAVVSGITEAVIAAGGDPDLLCVSPQNGVLVRSATGRAEILSCSAQGETALILLGSFGVNSGEYNGFFKIVRTANGVAVVDGGDPDNAVCGYTDLPGCIDVAKAEIAGSSGTVTLYIRYDENTHLYSAGFSGGSDAVLSWIIGRYTATSITQIWQSDTIFFSRFYFI